MTHAGVTNPNSSRTVLEKQAIDSDSLVGERFRTPAVFPSNTGHEKSCVNLSRPLDKAKYSLPPIANKYREGKVKSTPGGE